MKSFPLIVSLSCWFWYVQFSIVCFGINQNLQKRSVDNIDVLLYVQHIFLIVIVSISFVCLAVGLFSKKKT